MIGDKVLHLKVFNILWALAHVGHILRKEPAFQPLVWILLLSCVLLIERPSSPARLGLLSLSQISLFFARLPATDNHMYIMFFVNAGLLMTSVPMVLKNNRWDDVSASRLLSYPVIIFVIAYASAAIAKLNYAFFEPASSCAVVMFQDATAFLGAATTEVPNIVRGSLPLLIAAIELSIPICVLIKKLRLVGIIILVAFHIVISISATATAIDFTLIIFAIGYLILPIDASLYLKERASRLYTQLPPLLRDGTKSMPVLLLFFFLVVLVWRLGTVAGNRSWAILAPASVAVGLLLVVLAIRSISNGSSHSIGFSRIGVLHYLPIGLLILNAASPYLGIKTVGTFTMYSNLNTFGSQSNHFILPRLAAGHGLHDDLVTIVRAPNEDLDVLRRRGLRITWHELRRHMNRNPTASISYIRDGDLYEYERADENSELIQLDPVLHKLVGHRPDDRHSPRCLW